MTKILVVKKDANNHLKILKLDNNDIVNLRKSILITTNNKLNYISLKFHIFFSIFNS